MKLFISKKLQAPPPRISNGRPLITQINVACGLSCKLIAFGLQTSYDVCFKLYNEYLTSSLGFQTAPIFLRALEIRKCKQTYFRLFILTSFPAQAHKHTR